MRKSSRGNPLHYPKGSPKGGQFAPKGTSGAVKVVNSEEYYEQRTAERMNQKCPECGAFLNGDGTCPKCDSEISKERQAEIIQFSNPANDDYHTWIRSADDIKTFSELKEEVMEEYDDDITPDYRRSDYENALKTGEITVYSSYNIDTGVFVSPSYMEAASYGGAVHEKKVKTSDVAWISATEGQFVGDGEFKDKYGFQCDVIDGNCHIGLRGEATSDYIRCASSTNNSFDKSKIKPVINPDLDGMISKPREGGIWMSAENAEFGWTEWTQQEHMDSWSENPERLKLKGAKILHLYDMDQVKRLPHKINSFGSVILDFESISEDYDAMEVHISDSHDLYSGLYGWDCDSTLVFNPNVVSKA